MRKQKVSFDNLDETLKASKSTKAKGTQQFETPQAQAAALCLALNPLRSTVFDPQCGHGALLRAAAMTGRYDPHELLGIDIDPTASIPDFASRFKVSRKVIVADFTKILPLLLKVKARFDLIVVNPPFSLRWEMMPFHWKQVNGRLEPCPGDDQPVTVDSTLATFEACHAMLSKLGEGLMLCNAATCDRLLSTHPLYARTWLRLNIPNFFPGTMAKMKVAALYFARGHAGTGPMVLDLPDAMPDTIARMLEFPMKNRDKLISGATVKVVNDLNGTSVDRFEAAAEQWKQMTDKKFAELNGWNIKLAGNGRLITYVTPFQSYTGEVPVKLAEALSSLHGKHPTELVVQRTSRRALEMAVNGGIWRVHPEAVAAVGEAMLAYNRSRAPLRPLNRVQRLGHLDEEDAIQCETAPCIGFTPGKSYPLESETFEGRKVEKRKHPRHPDEEEQVLVTGQELLLRVKDDAGQWHAFTQYELGATQEKDRPEKHFHLLSELVENFHIPDVPDVAALHPEEFTEYQRRLLELETA